MNCKKCGGKILWRKDAGQWQCYEADGVTVHWDTCSKRRWGQVVATGVRFEGKDCAGYHGSVNGTKLEWDSAGKVRPKQKLSGKCEDCCPPWEVCSKPCPNELRA